MSSQIVSQAGSQITSPLNTAIVEESVQQENHLPPQPADYDQYWYQDESGNWRNEYDDDGYVFNQER